MLDAIDHHPPSQEFRNMSRYPATIRLLLGQLTCLLSNATIPVTILALAVGFTQLDPEVLPTSGTPESSGSPGTGVVVGSEVLDLWLPRTAIDLARCDLQDPVEPTARDVKSALQRRGLEDLWYAITVRGYQVNGRSAELTYVRCPFREPENLQEFRAILTTLAGHQPAYPAVDFSCVPVHVLPADISREDAARIILARGIGN
jgi:hypothetical protein